MYRKRTLIERICAIAMALVLVVGTVPTSVFALGRGADGKTEMGLGELIVKNYSDLSKAEQDMLNSGLLTADKYSFEVPSTSEGLVTVDPVGKTVEVKPYTNEGYIWNAVSAAVKYDGGREEIELENGSGSFKYAGDNYSVEVTYEMYIAVELDKQQALLDAPGALSQGINNLDIIADSYDFLNQFAGYIGELYSYFVNPEGVAIKLNDEAAVNAITKLYEQAKENEGKFDLALMIEAYKAEGTKKIEYLMAHGAEMKACAAETFEYMNAINNAKSAFDAVILQLETLAQYAPNLVSPEEVAAKKDLMGFALRLIDDNVNNMKPAIEDAWTALDGRTYFRSDLSEVEYMQLNKLAEAAKGKCGEHKAEKTSLLADRTILDADVNRHNLKVFLVEYTIKGNDSAELQKVEKELTTIKVSDGATLEQIEALVKAAVQESDYLSIDPAFYDRTVETSFEGTLTKDGNYKIVYTPKTMTITSNVEKLNGMKVPYGYRLTLPVYAGTDGQAYLYSIECGENSDTYGEGKIYTVVGDVTITQNLGVMQEFNGGELISNSYGDISKEAAAILQSAALDTRFSLMFMLPENGFAEAVSGQTVKAENQDTGIDGISWVPTHVIFHAGEDSQKVAVVGGVATTTLKNYEYAEVVYQIDLTGEVDKADVLAVSNLPFNLVEEAKDQIEAMKFLANNRGTMATIDSSIVGMLLPGLFETEEAKAAVNDLKNNCFDSTNNRLVLVGYLNAYEADGLAYYYAGTNREIMQEQVDRIEKNLNAIIADPQFEALRSNPQFAAYKDKLDQVEELMEKMAEIDLPVVNKAINRNASNADMDQLAAAVNAAIEAGTTKEYKVAGELKYTSSINVTAPDRSVLNISVKVLNSNGAQVSVSEVISFTFDGASYTLTAEDKAAIAEAFAKLEASLNVKSDYYVGEVKIPETIQGSMSIVKTWTPREYDFTINGIPNSFHYDNPVINLPAPTEAGFQLVYTIHVGNVSFDQPVGYGNSVDVKLTAEQLAKINDGITVTVKVIDLAKQKVEQLVADLNAGLVNAGLTYEVGGNRYQIASFILVEDEAGKQSVVLRITPNANGVAVTGKVMEVAQTLMANSYIGLGGYKFFDAEEGKFYMQGIVDMLLDTGMSLQSVADLIDANGNIAQSLSGKNWTVVSTDSNIENASLLGGLLFQTSLELGIEKGSDPKSYGLYVTVEDFDRMSSPLSTANTALDRVLNYANITFANGAVNVNATAPDRLYQAYTTLMLLMNYADIEDLSAADYAGMVEEILGQVKDVIEATDDDGKAMLTAAVIQNTINMITGANIGDNVAKYISAGLRYLVNNADVTDNKMEGATYSASLSYDFAPVIDKLLGNNSLFSTVTGMIAEYENGIHADFTFTLENIEKTEYVAVVVDNSKTGLGKYRMVTEHDFANVLATSGNNAVIVLLNDITIPATTVANSVIIDLNGKTLSIDGTLTAKNRIIMLDTTLITEQAGTVNGKLAGNFVILAGRYEQNVTDYLKNGYKQVAGLVVNSLFNVEAAEGGYNVVINSDFMNKANIPNIRGLAVELIADLVLKVYNNGSLAIGDYGIYSVKYDDVVKLIDQGISLKGVASDLLECIDCEGITGFVNDFVKNITDFGKLAENVENGTPFVSYKVVTSNWDVLLHYGEGGNYLTGSLVEGAKNETMLNFTMDDTNKEALVKLLKELDQVVESDFNFQLENLELRGNGINLDSVLKSIDWSLNANVVVDLSNNANYPALIAILLASGGAANADELIAGVNTMLNDGFNGDLREALEKVPLNQIVSALKAVKGLTFNEVIADLNGLDVFTAPIKELEETYHDLLNVLYAALYRLGINGGNQTLGGIQTDVPGVYAYSLTRASATVSATLKLFGEIVPVPAIVVKDAAGKILYSGESLSAAFAACVEGATITINEAVELDADVDVACKILVENATKVTLGDKQVKLTNVAASNLTADASWLPNVISGVEGYEVDLNGNVFTLKEIVPAPVLGLPEINGESPLIAGYKITNKYIYLDVSKVGISLEQFKELVQFQHENGALTVEINEAGLNNELVVNGAKVTAKVTNKLGEFVERTYTVIIMGDVNCNGKIECGDLVLLKESYLGLRQLSEIEFKAADMNQNNKLDSGDAVKIEVKFVDWDNYFSKLNNTTDDQEDQ